MGTETGLVVEIKTAFTQNVNSAVKLNVLMWIVLIAEMVFLKTPAGQKIVLANVVSMNALARPSVMI